MQAPYQCIEKCGRILIAASGPSLHAFSLSDGSRQASWTSPLVSNLKLKQEETSDERNVRINSQIPDLVSPSGPPAKRRKFSGGENNPLNERIKASHQLGDGGSQGPQSAAAPAVVYLRSTQNGKHVIAVTGEDKTIRVFEWNGKDNLKQLSERYAPICL
jgi:tRNA (guanine-N(7)-)-methyltransferase subunit TRM82